MIVLETERLIIRPLRSDDAPFILMLLNEPSFIRYIGDKKVRNLNDAEQYILNGPVASYERHGLGLCLVELRETGTPVGMCGLLKRDELPHPDIGFAFLPEFWGKGFAFEAAAVVLEDARERLQLTTILAITTKNNESSIKLLQRLGLKCEGVVRIGEEELFLHSS
jgi:[ribosomal protein S5]-alanine N-acetyltransferase